MSIYEILTIVALVLAPVCSVIAVFVGQYLIKNEQKRKDKLYIFGILMANRLKWTDESVRALNLIDICFYDCDKVRLAFKEYRENLNSEDAEKKKLILLETMSMELGYSKVRWDTISSPCVPVEYANEKKDDDLRKTIEKHAMLQVSGLGELAGEMAVAVISQSKSNPTNNKANRKKNR